MDVSKEEAQKSLGEIQDTVQRTKKMVAYAGGDTLFIVWGVIWVLGYLSTHFLPLLCQWVWLVLVAAGIIISIMVNRSGMPLRIPAGKNIAWFWLLLYLYASLWIALLFPFIKVRGHEQSQMFWRHMGAILATVPMFAYVVMGFWLARFMVWLGLAVTALTFLGLLAIQPYFWLWMAAAGGGTLIGTGLFIRNRWR